MDDEANMKACSLTKSDLLVGCEGGSTNSSFLLPRVE